MKCPEILIIDIDILPAATNIQQSQRQSHFQMSAHKVVVLFTRKLNFLKLADGA